MTMVETHRHVVFAYHDAADASSHSVATVVNSLYLQYSSIYGHNITVPSCFFGYMEQCDATCQVKAVDRNRQLNELCRHNIRRNNESVHLANVFLYISNQPCTVEPARVHEQDVCNYNILYKFHKTYFDKKKMRPVMYLSILIKLRYLAGDCHNLLVSLTSSVY